MARGPLVSIVIPTYNRAHTVIAALDSVLEQTYEAIEVLLVDDGSRDDTAAVVRAYLGTQPRRNQVRYIRQENAGAPSARNRGIRESSGDLLQFLDSDDGLYPSKLATQVRLFAEMPEVEMVYCRCRYRYFTDQGVPAGEAIVGEPTEDPVGLMIRRCFFHINAPLWRREICERAGPWDVTLPSSQDWDYGFRLLLQVKQVSFHAETLAWARRQKAGSIGNLPDRVQCEAALKVRRKMLEELQARPALAAAWQNQYVLGAVSQAMYFAARGHDDLAEQLARTAQEQCGRGWGGHAAAALLAVGRCVGWQRLETVRTRLSGRPRTVRAERAPRGSLTAGIQPSDRGTRPGCGGSTSGPRAATTIVFVTRNRRAELVRALHAAESQTVRCRVLVLDDASEDDTSDILRTQFPRVTHIRSDRVMGPSYQRNRGIAAAETDTVVVLDDDALLQSPRTIEQTLADFADPRIGAVAIPYLNVYQDRTLRNAAPDRHKVYIGHAFVAAAHAVRRDDFVAAGGYREYLFYMGEEGDLCLRMLSIGKVIRFGTADPVHHLQPAGRVSWLADYYGRRNDILVPVLTAPGMFLPWILAGTTVNGLRHGFWCGRPARMAYALLGGFMAAVAKLGDRQPVSPTTYRLFRHLKVNEPVSLNSVGLNPRFTGDTPPLLVGCPARDDQQNQLTHSPRSNGRLELLIAIARAVFFLPVSS